MANITKRTNKKGEISYLIRAFVGEGADGKQITKSTTWKPPAGMKQSAADKQAEKEAVLFEEKIKTGVITIDGNIKFADYAAQWLETKEFKPKTVEIYEMTLKKINAAIGHIPLEKIRPEHIQQFIKNLKEDGVKQNGSCIMSPAFDKVVKKRKIAYADLGRAAGITYITASRASRGKRTRYETAKKLCAVLDLNLSEYTITDNSTTKLSNATIRRYYAVIQVVLAAAKKSRIIPHNVTEFTDPPKKEYKEARYLDDEEAKRFLAIITDNPDIRIKTAFTVLLWTGMRKGELCGLEWNDIDFYNNTINICRASQYVKKQGVIEVSTKNRSSERRITVSPFIIGLLKDYRIWWIEQRFKCGDTWQGNKERLFIQANGKPIFPETLNDWIYALIDRHNLPSMTVHSLRHTFITLQIANGTDIKTIQSMSGHATPMTLLNTYTHAIESAQEKAAQAMDNILLPPGQQKSG